MFKKKIVRTCNSSDVTWTRWDHFIVAGDLSTEVSFFKSRGGVAVLPSIKATVYIPLYTVIILS